MADEKKELCGAEVLVQNLISQGARARYMYIDVCLSIAPQREGQKCACRACEEEED